MLFGIIISFLIWTTYYFVLFQRYRNCSAEWISRIVALTHAFLIARLIEVCMFTGPWPIENLGESNTECQNKVLMVSAGYFIFETIWCLYMQTEGVLMLLHHSISVTAMLGSLSMGASAAEVTLTTWGSELTNPFLQIRWFLRETNGYETQFAYLNDMVFIATFFVVRVCVGAVLAYYLYFSTKTVVAMKVGGYAFYVISLVWMCLIFKFAAKRFCILKPVKVNKTSHEKLS